MIYNHLTTLTSLTSIIAVVTVLLTNQQLIHLLLSTFHPLSHPFAFSALFISLYLNAKTLPFVWHIRKFKHILNQLYFQPRRLEDLLQNGNGITKHDMKLSDGSDASNSAHGALFKPLIAANLHTPLGECDHNGHKSNSTYFSDVDQALTMHITGLLRKGIRGAAEYDRTVAQQARHTLEQQPQQHQDNAYNVNVSAGLAAPSSSPASASTHTCTSTVKGTYIIALGGVSCHFKREIKPYERYDIWTRVLAWDRKWIYLVSHFVAAGTVQPTDWLLQPWKNGNGKSERQARQGQSWATGEKGAAGRMQRKDSGVGVENETNEHGDEHQQQQKWRKAVFATSVARYVIKKGRLTVAPEECFRRADLLPTKVSENAATEKNSQSEHAEKDGTAWTWQNVEAKRLKGLQYAEKFAALEELHDAWPLDGDVPGMKRTTEDGRKAVEVIGEFVDMW